MGFCILVQALHAPSQSFFDSASRIAAAAPNSWSDELPLKPDCQKLFGTYSPSYDVMTCRAMIVTWMNGFWVSHVAILKTLGCIRFQAILSREIQGPVDDGGVSNGGVFPIWTSPALLSAFLSFLPFFLLFCPSFIDLLMGTFRGAVFYHGGVPLLINSEIWRRGSWKRGICIKLSEIDFQIGDTFATILRTLPLMYEMKYQQFCATLARNLRQICATPPSRTPPSRDSRLMGRFPALTGPFPECLNAVFVLENPL